MSTLSHHEMTLEPLGLDEADEQVYRALIETSSASVTELTRVTGLAPSRIRSTLKSLESLGLASRSSGKTLRYMASPPDVALEVLILARQEQLQRVRAVAAGLTEHFREAHKQKQAINVIEVVEGADAVAQRVRQMEVMAQTSVMVFDKPPYLDAPPDAGPPENREEQDLLERGVVCRAIYSHESLRLTGVATIHQMMTKGEQARVWHEVPAKLQIVDNRIAAVPVVVSNRVEAAALIHPSPLLDLLIAVFESYWERSLPISSVTQQQGVEEIAGENVAPSDDQRKLVTLLLAGLTEEAIASQLSVDARTVRRRINKMFDTLGAETRFQAGVQAAKRGWV